MTLLTKGMGVVKKIMAKTSAGRKDQVLDVIKKSRAKRIFDRPGGGVKIKRKKVTMKDIEGKKITVDDESKIMDPDTYSTVSSASDKNIKKWLKHKGFKE